MSTLFELPIAEANGESHMASGSEAASESPDTSATDTSAPGDAGQPGSSYWEQFAEWSEQRADLEHRLSQAALDLSAAKERVKGCRERFDGLTGELQYLEYRKPRIEDVAPVAAAEVAPDVPPLDGPNAWRSAPISQLDLSVIKGLGPKKIEALYAKCPTIGDLEDLRAKGSGKGVGLRSIKGIGEDAAQAIEDAVLAWLTEHRDREVFAKCNSEGPVLVGLVGTDSPSAASAEAAGE